MSASTVDERPSEGGEEVGRDEEMPKMGITRRRALLFALFVASSLAFLYFVLPEIAGMGDTWQRVGDGEPGWLAVALVFQVLAMGSYIAIFQGVHVPPGSPITYRQSYLITMAGLAATRLFAAGGAGGVAVTAWALRRSGMDRREVAERMIAFLVLLYWVYTLAVVIGGFGLRWGVFPGDAPFSVTVVPAVIGLIAMAIAAAIALVPEDLERRIARAQDRPGRLGRIVRRVATAPASASGGIRFALTKIRHPDLAMAGVVTWWAFNVGVLWASFEAFGDAPPLAVVVVGFFVGMLGNLLPLPGGIGGVDGGMIGAFAVFGVGGSLTVPAVLTYRLFAFWLPSIPGAIAYFQLRKTVDRWDEQGLMAGAARS